MKWYNTLRYQSPLARRVLIWTVLFSSVITLLFTFFQLYLDYRSDVHLIETTLGQVETVHLPTLTESLWATNEARLQLQLEGILRQRDMLFLEVRDDQQIWATAGQRKTGSTIERHIPIIHTENGKPRQIGTLTAVATLDGVYQRLIDKSLVILLSNAIKTFLVASFILYLFHRFVTRHLQYLSTRLHNPELATDITLQRAAPTPRDELDDLVTALNGMRQRIQATLTELRTSETRLALALEGAKEGLWDWNIKSNLVYRNMRTKAIFGYGPDDLQGTYESWEQQLHPEDRHRVLENLTAHLKDSNVVYNPEFRIRQKNGSWRWVLSRGQVVERDAEDKPLRMVGTFADIDERKKMELALVDQKEYSENLIQTANVMVVTLDTDGYVTRLNRSGELTTGYTEAEVLGKNWFELVVPKDQYPRVWREFNRIIAGDVSISFENPIRTKSGKERHILWSNSEIRNAGEIVGSISFGKDITERKEMEDELRASQANLAAAQERARIGSWTFDFAEQTGTWSPEMFRIFGKAPALGVPPLSEFIAMVHPDDRPLFEELYRRSLAQRIGHRQDYRVILADGSIRWVETRSEMICDDAGQPQKMVGTTQDITERKLTEQALQQFTHELEQRVLERTAELAESNAELEAFSYTVSHDLRAPLRAVQGLAQALLEDHAAQLDKLGQEYARRLVGAAERMDGLIQDLLAYSRLSRAQLRPEMVEIDAIVQQALEQLTDDIRKSAAKIQVKAGLPRVPAHPGTFTQAVANLIANAIKFVPAGVTPQITIHTEQHARDVRLWVEDNGIGIDPEHHERIFRVFERLHGIETYPGTGIGLAIVRKGIERMGGSVGVISALGKGSRFFIELPRESKK